MRYLDRRGFGELLRSFVDAGYALVGPTVRDGAIVLEEIEGISDLPAGVGEEQGPGTYRLARREDDRLFGWAHGPDAGKRFLFPPRETLATIRRNGSMHVTSSEHDDRPFAFVGLRSCDLHAIAVQDRVFMELDPAYRRRRERAVFIGVNCSEPGSTCFCVSMGTGPRCTIGFDLALTELTDGFGVEVGSPRGEELLSAVSSREATAEETAEVDRILEAATARMGRELDTSDLPGLLYRNRQHPRWADVAERCLACANCTNVCPTCFCHDVVDGVSLSGDTATRTREWASCFSQEYSWAAGETVRMSRDSRYRQWLTHKFASWIDQYGTSGCIGCGRCITWCPVGIDVTEEISAIRVADGETVRTG
ncbi:MAG TPA: 4Fe-4S dicluster domain-containing protein [Actinomycetota bacterium]|jgi:ferredoxin|nr:4Fe-4S dicluster domain-containing protein [Actinomycetota bacterium]